MNKKKKLTFVDKDSSTLTAVCYLESPLGTSSSSNSTSASFPCSLVWASKYDLFIGWADSFRHLELMKTSEVMGGNANSNSSSDRPEVLLGIIIRSIALIIIYCIYYLPYF